MLRLALFDLDNTLYPESSGMDRDITRRMLDFVARFLGTSVEEARALRHERARLYGTTLEWITVEHAFRDVEAYFAAVHPDGEEYCIAANPELGPILDSIPAAKAVLTNSPVEHAERVLAKLGVRDRFGVVHDIRANGLRGKPHAEAYRRACELSGASIAETIFIDDMPKYARGFMALGGRAVLVDEAGRYGSEAIPAVRELSELPALLASL
jgi:putative hydrolase of the HAD superfamily